MEVPYLQMDLLDSFHLPPFKENTEGSVGVRWKKWLKQFELHLTVKNIEDPELKRTHLLYFGKEDIQKVLELEPEVCDYVSDVYQRAVRRLNEYYLPKVSRIYERSLFRRMTREAEEKIESFILRLRKQAEFCDFAEQTDWMIVDQIVEKMSENELKKKILKGNFSLEEIQGMISAHEIVKKQVNDITPREDFTSVNAVQLLKRPSDNGRSDIECYACGKQGHRAKHPSCPAVNKQCGNCRRVGHFSIKCFKKFKNGNDYSFKRQFGGRDNGGNSRQQFNINQVSDDYYSKPEHEVDIIYNINAGSEVHCKVGGIAMNLLLDTGAAENIIGENDWNRFKNQFKIYKQLVGSDKDFRAYGSKEILNVIGRVEMDLEVNSKSEKVWFYIIQNGQRSLMSGVTAGKFELITMKTGVVFPKLRGT